MNKFDSLDSFSYQCGVIDAFNEDLPAVRQPFLRRAGAAAHRPFSRLDESGQV